VRPWRSKTRDSSRRATRCSPIVAHDLRNPIHAGQFATAAVLRPAASRRGRRESPQERRDLVRSSARAIRLNPGPSGCGAHRGGACRSSRIGFPDGWSSRPRSLNRTPGVRVLRRARARCAGSRSRCLGRPRSSPPGVSRNFIGNALKFTAPGGRDTLGAAAQEKVVLFWVRIPGAGIDAESLPHLFERIYQPGRPTPRCGAGGSPSPRHRRGARRKDLGGDHPRPW